MRLTVKIPQTGMWVATIRVPDEAQENIVGFLEDNPEYIDDIIENGHLEAENLSLLDAQVVLD